MISGLRVRLERYFKFQRRISQLARFIYLGRGV